MTDPLPFHLKTGSLYEPQAPSGELPPYATILEAKQLIEGLAEKLGLPSRWDQNFLAYDSLVAFSFQTDGDLKACLSLLSENPSLKGVPRKGSGRTLIVPDLASDYLFVFLTAQEVAFERDRVRKISEFTPDVAARMRQRAGLVY